MSLRRKGFLSWIVFTANPTFCSDNLEEGNGVI